MLCMLTLVASNNAPITMSSSPQNVSMQKEKEALSFLQVDVLLRMLRISGEFLPQNLWTWVNHSKADGGDVLYLEEVKEQIYDSWRAFKITGHGAIELGTFQYPTTLKNAPFGMESWDLSYGSSVFLKMNIDEYLNLIDFIDNIISGDNLTTSSPTSPPTSKSSPSPTPTSSPCPLIRSPRRASRKHLNNRNKADGDIKFRFYWWVITLIVVGGVIILGLLICLGICYVKR
jgi:hypothetical protein